MDRHLNVFFLRALAAPRDQLTRAAMIVMRAVPLARDALLARIGAHPSARLPEPELDMQTSHVHRPPVLPLNGRAPCLHRLMSVFLSPDEGLDLSTAKIQERVREQRLDGVLRFGDELVVVIESKASARRPVTRPKSCGSHGVKVEQSKVMALGWHELLEDWWALLERGLLAPAERVLMEDLVAFAEEHFAHLLPFTTLGRAGEHDLRRRRRLVALLREATGLDEVEPGRGPLIGATLMTETVIGTQSTQRIVLRHRNGSLVLATWPAELKPKAEALYRTGRAQRLIDFLAAHPGTWQARPNVHLAFHNAPSAQRLYLHCHLDTSDYIRRWTGDDFAQGRRAPPRPHPGGPVALASRAAIRRPPRTTSSSTHSSTASAAATPICAQHRMQRTWPWAQAVDLDERGALAAKSAPPSPNCWRHSTSRCPAAAEVRLAAERPRDREPRGENAAGRQPSPQQKATALRRRPTADEPCDDLGICLVSLVCIVPSP